MRSHRIPENESPNLTNRYLLLLSVANGKTWSAHRVELALWTHYVASELKPELLDGIPIATENGNSHSPSNGEATEPSDDSNQEPAVVVNGKESSEPHHPNVIDDNSTTNSFTEDSMDKPSTPLAATEDDDSNNTPRPTDSEDTEDSQDVQEPPAKKNKK